MDLTLHLNARLQPMHRHPLEDMLQEFLERENLGNVMGGGTSQEPTHGEITSCDIEISLNDNSKESVDRLIEIIDYAGIPKGSTLLCTEPETRISVGNLDGLAYYYSGNPEATGDGGCDINDIVKQMETAITDAGAIYSYWACDKWIAFYFYGGSFDEMKRRIEPVIENNRLTRVSRIEKIA